MNTVLTILHRLRYLSTLGIPQRGSVNLINDVTPTNELVKVSLTTRGQVKDKDTSAEIPERKSGEVKALDRSNHENVQILDVKGYKP